MQMNIVSVQPETLLERSSKMMDSINSAKATYNELMKLVEDSVGWKGEDAIAFSVQFKGFQDDVEALEKLLNAYVNVIKQCYEGYVKTQEELYTQGKCL